MSAPRYQIDLPLRFRVPGEPQWHRGKTVNISRSGLLFTCDEMLEVGTELELYILFPRDDGSPAKPLRVCRGQVVRRVLMQWPDLSTSVGIQFAGVELQNYAPLVIHETA